MNKKRITVIPGDGIGPSIMSSTLKVLEHLQCGFTYDFADAGETSFKKRGELLPQETMFLIRKNAVALKGPIMTPIGEGFTSINVTLRKAFDLYANVRPVVSFAGVRSKYENVDIITVRENTEGMYSGQGQNVTADGDRGEAVSVITHKGSERIARFAFELARKNGRKKVTIVHKANILKSTSGLFLATARDVAREFEDIQCNEMIVDNCSMQLTMNPHQFDIILTTNLFGDIISDLCAGLVGGLGLAPSANLGEDTAIFEAVHGSAPDIAGKNIANPAALMLASAMMLDHLRMTPRANRLRQALRDVIACGDRVTKDLGGTGSTDEFTQSVMERL